MGKKFIVLQMLYLGLLPCGTQTVDIVMKPSLFSHQYSSPTLLLNSGNFPTLDHL